jgi:predicted RND superfamily exporter protein
MGPEGLILLGAMRRPAIIGRFRTLSKRGSDSSRLANEPAASGSRLVAWLLAARWWLLAVTAATFLIAFPASRRLSFDRRIDAIFRSGSTTLSDYKTLRDRFGGNELVLLVYQDPELLAADGQGLERLDRLGQALKPLDGIQGILSLAQVNQTMETLRGGVLRELLGGTGPALLAADDPMAREFRQLFAGYTHSTDARWAAVGVMLTPGADDQRTLEEIREALHQQPEPVRSAKLVGEPVLVDEGFALVEADGRRLGTTSLLLMSVVLLLTLRSLRWMLAPLAIIAWSLVMTRAILVWLDLQLTLVSAMLSAIVTVIAVATTLHIAISMMRGRRHGLTTHQAAEQTLSRMLPPTGWAIATDIAGFGSLLFARVEPVRQFGLMMSIAAAAVLAAIVLITPAAMLCGPHLPPSRALRGDYWLRHILAWPGRALSIRGQRLAALCILAVSAVVAGGNFWLTTETDFTRNFRADYELVAAYQDVEQHLGGAGVWDVILPAPAELTDAYLASVRELEEKLRAIEFPGEVRLNKVLSIADADLAAQADPILAATPVSVRLAGMRAAMSVFADALLTPTNDLPHGRSLRLMLRSREQLSAGEKLRLIEAVDQVVAEHTASAPWRATFDGATPSRAFVTGYHVLLTRLLDNLLGDQWRCLVAAIIGVGILLLIVSRSLYLALIALVINAIPALVVLGALGWLGHNVNLGAAMIAAVSLGLTIDGSLHWLAVYRRALNHGHDPRRAALRAQAGIGLAVALATVALVAGFGTLWTSPFLPTATFGVLVSAALGLGSLLNLYVLPVLASWPDERRSRA